MPGLRLRAVLLRHVALDEARGARCWPQRREAANNHNRNARRFGAFHETLGNAWGGLGRLAARGGGGDHNVGPKKCRVKNGGVDRGTGEVGDPIDRGDGGGPRYDGDGVAAAQGFGDYCGAGVAGAAKNGDVCHVASNAGT